MALVFRASSPNVRQIVSLRQPVHRAAFAGKLSPLPSSFYLRRRLASEGIVSLGLCVCVCPQRCVSSWRAEPWLHAALVSAAKVMRCIQFSLVFTARRYAERGIYYGNSVCPSVRLSVTRVDQSKTVEAKITQFSLYSSPIPLVFDR